MTITSIQGDDVTTIQVGRSTLAVTVPSVPLTDAAWFIDSVNGDDGNSGLTSDTALASVTEFNSRIQSGVFMQATTVTCSGDFSTESFQGTFQFSADGTLQVIGEGVEVEASLTLTGVTELDESGSEVQTLEVSGHDFTSNVGQRIRFLDGNAAGMICWIAATDPNGVGGTDNIRVSAIGTQTATFQVFSFTIASPSIGDSFTIETQTPLGGIDVEVYEGNKTTGSFLVHQIQYESFELLQGSDSARVAVAAKEGGVLFGCAINTQLAGPSGNLDLDFCNFSGVIAAFGGLTPIFDSGLVSGSTNMNVIGGFFSRRMVYQAASLTVRAQVSMTNYNAFFDTSIGINIRFEGFLEKQGDMYGSGITDVGVKIESPSQMSFDVVPTLIGDTAAIRIGGTDFATYALGQAASPINGAGLYLIA